MWWDDNRLLAWLALAWVAGIFLTTTGLRIHDARRRAGRLRNAHVLLGNLWGTAAWDCALCGVGFRVAAIV